MKKKIILLSTVVILAFALCACGNDGDSGSNIYDTYTDSLQGFVAAESGDENSNPEDYLYATYEKDGVNYSLIYSKTETSEKDVFYLVRTMKIDDKYITDKISEDADLSEKLTEKNPYVATTMQNHGGDVFFYIVKVMDDTYTVQTKDEKDVDSPKKNIYVETGETEPVLKIVHTEKAD